MSSNDQIDLLESEKKIYFDILFQSVLPFFLCISVKRLKFYIQRSFVKHQIAITVISIFLDRT